MTLPYKKILLFFRLHLFIISPNLEPETLITGKTIPHTKFVGAKYHLLIRVSATIEEKIKLVLPGGHPFSFEKMGKQKIFNFTLKKRQKYFYNIFSKRIDSNYYFYLQARIRCFLSTSQRQ